MGGSGGGGGPYYDVHSDDLTKRLDKSAEAIAEGFLPRLQEMLETKLDAYSRRDHELMGRRREEIKAALADLLETTWDLSYGGSVAKHTFVDGLSDVDSLLIMKDGNPENVTPSEIRDRVAGKLRHEIGDVEIIIGKLAITLKYTDGMEIQLVPAVRDDGGYKVPAWDKDAWSKISPQEFRRALTRRNEQCDGKLIPVIKLIKAITATWPEAVQMSGYHIESLAIDAFGGYQNEKTIAKMLPVFFERAANAVLAPMRDETGQSINVDDYLGGSHSIERRKVSHWCTQTAKKMKQGSIQGSASHWEDLFE